MAPWPQHLLLRLAEIPGVYLRRTSTSRPTFSSRPWLLGKTLTIDCRSLSLECRLSGAYFRLRGGLLGSLGGHFVWFKGRLSTDHRV